MEVKAQETSKNRDQDSEDSFDFNEAKVKGPQASLPLKMPQNSNMMHNKEVGPLCFNTYKSASLVEVGLKIIESVKLKTLRKQSIQDDRPRKR